LAANSEGEANFSTNYGDIDAVFVPKPQTCADFEITASDGSYPSGNVTFDGAGNVYCSATSNGAAVTIATH
jgi:hypothetical protein